jgi:hypothetical protein
MFSLALEKAKVALSGGLYPSTSLAGVTIGAN